MNPTTSLTEAIARFPRPEQVPHGMISAISALPGGRILVAHMHKVAQQTWLAVYDPATGAGRVLATPQRGVVNQIISLPDGRIVAASRPQGDDPGVVCFYDPALSARQDLWPARMCRWDRDTGEAILKRRTGALSVVHLASGESRLEFSTEGLAPGFHDPFGAGPAFRGRRALFVPDPNRVVALTLAAEAPRVVMDLDFEVARVVSAGPLAALIGFDGRLELRDAATGAVALDLSVAGREVVPESVSVLAGGIFAAWEDGGSAIWSLPSGERLGSYPAPPDLHPVDTVRGPLTRVAFDAGGRFLVATHMDQHLHVLDRASGVWVGHWAARAPITAFALTGSGVLMGDQDGHARLVEAP